MKNRQYTLAQNSMFNMIGSLVYYVCQWAVTMAVVRLSTDQNIGELQLAMTVSNIFVSVANYNLYTYLISDIQGEYAVGHYVAVRLFTCGVALILCVGYSIIWQYPARSILCIALYMIYRLIERIAEILYAIDQKHARMDHVMVSYSMRGILMLAIFIVMIIATDNIFIAISAMSLITFAVILFYDIRCTSRYESIRPLFEWKKMKGILIACFPTMLGAVLFTAIVTIPRQNLGKIMGQDLLGYYATVATPLVFVQVMVNSLMSPSISEISVARENMDKKRFWGLTSRMNLIILGVGIVAVLGVMLLGKPIMTLLYGEKIIPYISLMYAVIGCTVTYAVCSVCFNLLIVLRKMTAYLLICAGALAIAVSLSNPMIQRFGADGVSFSVLISYICAALASFVVIRIKVKEWDQKESA